MLARVSTRAGEEIRLLADADPPGRSDPPRWKLRCAREACGNEQNRADEHHEGTFFQSRVDRGGTQPIDSVVQWPARDKGRLPFRIRIQQVDVFSGACAEPLSREEAAE